MRMWVTKFKLVESVTDEGRKIYDVVVIQKDRIVIVWDAIFAIRKNWVGSSPIYSTKFFE